MKNWMLLAFVTGTFLAFQLPAPVLTNDALSEKMTFQEFLEEFEQTDLPFVLDHNDLIPEFNPYDWESAADAQHDEKVITTDYQDFFPHVERRRFSRMGPSTYYFEQQLAQTDKFILVLYSESQPMAMMKEHYTLVTYSPDGKIIDEFNLAHAYGLTDVTMGSINKNLEITKTYATVEWKEEPYMVAVEENEITELKLVESTKTRISKSGKFIDEGSFDAIPIEKPTETLDNA
ncbi:MAG: hypothetical protein AAFV80_14265 [Bacteroidota bacterium]